MLRCFFTLFRPPTHTQNVLTATVEYLIKRGLVGGRTCSQTKAPKPKCRSHFCIESMKQHAAILIHSVQVGMGEQSLPRGSKGPADQCYVDLHFPLPSYSPIGAHLFSFEPSPPNNCMHALHQSSTYTIANQLPVVFLCNIASCLSTNLSRLQDRCLQLGIPRVATLVRHRMQSLFILFIYFASRVLLKARH